MVGGIVLRPVAVERGTCVVTVHCAGTFNGASIPDLLMLWAKVGQVAKVDYDNTVTVSVVSNPKCLQKDFVAIVDI